MKRRLRTPLRLFYWGAAAWIIALIPMWRLATLPDQWRGFPETPISNVHGFFAWQWKFLLSARHAVLPGSTYTVRAENPDDEMSMYMFSLGLCTRRTALPTSYFGVPRPEGAKARYVIAYGDYTGGEQGLRFVVRFPGGTVYERVSQAR